MSHTHSEVRVPWTRALPASLCAMSLSPFLRFLADLKKAAIISTMKQSTLPFSKSSASPVVQANKRPIVLDGSDEEDEAPAASNKKSKVLANPVPVTSSSSSAPESCLPTSSSLSSALDVPDLPFPLAQVLPAVEPLAIHRDAHDLDLLFFKSFVGSIRAKNFFSDPSTSSESKGKCHTANELFEYLRQALPFYRVQYTVRGIHINTPRYTCVWGCDGTGAPPSAYKIQPRPIPKVLKELKDWVEQRTNAKFNFVLVNYYADGNE